jgi:pyruvate dehydrogenase E1 component
MTDEQIDRLKRGGHDLVKIHAAYDAAARHRGQPTVILAHTKKGYGMGTAGQGKMTTHSQKKLDEAALLEFRNRFNLPLSDEQAKNLAFFKPAEDSAEMRYLHARRAALGGYMPQRADQCARGAGAGRRQLRAVRAAGRAARRCRPRWPSCACSARC